MYLLSRILFALSRLAVEKGFIPQPKHDPFPLFATLVWGIVLWLYEYYPHTLQPSLQSSMNYLYHDSNVWHDISDFLVYNKPRTQKWSISFCKYGPAFYNTIIELLLKILLKLPYVKLLFNYSLYCRNFFVNVWFIGKCIFLCIRCTLYSCQS